MRPGSQDPGSILRFQQWLLRAALIHGGKISWQIAEGYKPGFAQKFLHKIIISKVNIGLVLSHLPNVLPPKSSPETPEMKRIFTALCF